MQSARENEERKKCGGRFAGSNCQNDTFEARIKVINGNTWGYTFDKWGYFTNNETPSEKVIWMLFRGPSAIWEGIWTYTVTGQWHELLVFLGEKKDIVKIQQVLDTVGPRL